MPIPRIKRGAPDTVPGARRPTGSGTPLTEPGQGAFAALFGAVVALAAYPDTDWSQADVAGLREHLLQMDALITDTVAEAHTVDGGHAFAVCGQGRALEAIRTMVPAHARVLEASLGWEVKIEPIDDGSQRDHGGPRGKQCHRAECDRGSARRDIHGQGRLHRGHGRRGPLVSRSGYARIAPRSAGLRPRDRASAPET